MQGPRAIETKRFRLSSPALACAVACAAVFFAPAPAHAATITVNSTADTTANDGACTLREAIIAANTNTASGAAAGECVAGAAGLDTIAFNIAGAGVKTITPASLLPAVTEAVFINGYTQPGTSANTNAFPAALNTVLLIEVDGTLGGSQLTISAAGTTVRGIVFNRGGDEIRVAANNVTIAGNFIGTNPAGTAAMGNPSGGFAIRQVLGNNNAIGGNVAGDRNLLSGDTQGAVSIDNGDGTLIQGNFIGTDITGTAALNGTGFRRGVTILGPVFFATSNTRIFTNLISGNNGGGLTISSAGGLSLWGNLIGTQRDGVGVLGNGQFGVAIPAGSANAIGGTAAGQGNTIAFNQAGGVLVQGPGGFNNRILGNSIHSNTGLGIVLGSGTPLVNDACDVDTVPGNLGQNYPVITSAPIAAGNVTISGTLNSTASTTFRLEFFSNLTADPSGNGEGQTFLGSTNVTTNGTCSASFGPLVFAVSPGQTVFSATATDPANNTSEFSAAFAAGAPPSADLSVTKTGGPNPVTAGGNITYAIGVANGGPSAAASVSLTDTLPANTTFVSFAAPAGWVSTTPSVGGTGTVTATNGSLANGGTASFMLVVQVNGGTPGGTVITNTASVGSATVDPNGTNNSASAGTTVSAAGPPPVVQVIPTLSPWAMATLTLLLAALGWIGVARRGE